MTKANPSKGGDAKPPVYWTKVLRQRGCQESTNKPSVPLFIRRIAAAFATFQMSVDLP
jgi:hypothetical protein